VGSPRPDGLLLRWRRSGESRRPAEEGTIGADRIDQRFPQLP